MADIMKLVREWEAKRQGKSPSEKLAQKNGWSLTTATEKAEDGKLWFPNLRTTAGTTEPPGKLPWPGYNGGKQFRCDLCHTYFDTSVGFAKHQVNGCDATNKATEATAKTLSRCPACGSYAPYREKDGAVTCRTCELREV